MKRNISENLRQQVASRAAFRCEYCRLHESDMFFRFQVDHIVSIKHGGDSVLDNLALCCPDCNRNKGSDLGTRVGDPPELIRFFNPRIDSWIEHFEVSKDAEIISKSSIGEATVKIFQLNTAQRVSLRLELIESKRYF